MLKGNIIEDFTNKPVRIIKRITNLENYYRDIYIKILKIAKYKKLELPDIDLNLKTNCYIAKSCDDQKLLKLIDDYLDKLDQIDYSVNLLYNEMNNDIQYKKELDKNRAKAISNINKNVDDNFKKVFGFDYNMGFSDYVNDPEQVDNIKNSIKNGDIDSLKKLANSPKILEAVKKVDTNTILQNLNGKGSYDSSASEMGRALLDKSLKKPDPLNKELIDKDALDAKDSMDDNLKKIELPDNFTKYVKPTETEADIKRRKGSKK
jgi:uncharacterized protein YeeX (DUF496 family)